ncbi:hypothetical protein [Streptomyces sp. NEAU-174]|uniref:hypothetical protein n=1 Tax=Streptomyces sp. NEAU-174 TaxID=3458254 RepID=UPI004043DD64
MSQPPTSKREFHLVPIDPDGEYITAAERVVQEKGIPGFTQTVRPNAGEFAPEESLIIDDLQDLLPEQVHLPEKNPFLTLRTEVPVDGGNGGPELRECKCECGLSGSCGGGGGGGSHLV